jgi:hypothetical protein
VAVVQPRLRVSPKYLCSALGAGSNLKPSPESINDLLANSSGDCDAATAQIVEERRNLRGGDPVVVVSPSGLGNSLNSARSP